MAVRQRSKSAVRGLRVGAHQRWKPEQFRELGGWRNGTPLLKSASAPHSIAVWPPAYRCSLTDC